MKEGLKTAGLERVQWFLALGVETAAKWTGRGAGDKGVGRV